jgi:DNA topoisomerase III
MADQIVITEKSSQAKDVRAAVGSRYGEILAAEGHLFDLLEPEDVVPAWKRWSPILLRPAGLYGTRPAEGGNKAAKLRAIREALLTAQRVWLATDCDREGQLIGQEILEHYVQLTRPPCPQSKGLKCLRVVGILHLCQPS